MCEVEGKTKLVTGSSDGYIQVWHVMQEKVSIRSLQLYPTLAIQMGDLS